MHKFKKGIDANHKYKQIKKIRLIPSILQQLYFSSNSRSYWFTPFLDQQR